MPWSLAREPVAGLSHLVAALFASVGLVLLWRRTRGDGARLVSVMVFAGSMALLYTASATYHLVDAAPAVVLALRKIDHAAVFVLIAGTFTALGVNLLDGIHRLASLIGIWLAGATGVALKFAYFDMPAGLSTGLYLAMGWLGILLYARLRRRVSDRALLLIVLGGTFYSAGALLDLWQWPVVLPGVIESHELFHLFVIGGSAAHFAFVFRYVAAPAAVAGDKDGSAGAPTAREG